MKVYHGTIYENYKSILNDKEIKVTNISNRIYNEKGALTTLENIYLTDSPWNAIAFANRAWSAKKVDKGKRNLVIFEIEIDEDELKLDPDEEIPTSDVENSKCFIIKRNIKLNEIKRISNQNFKSYQDCCNFYDNRKKIDWIKL